MAKLFIPLKTEYYVQFFTGQKCVEMRLEGPRWNSKTCYPGRFVTLSCGYGKKHRMGGVIMKTWKEENCREPDFVKLFGKGNTARFIHIAIYPPDKKRELDAVRDIGRLKSGLKLLSMYRKRRIKKLDEFCEQFEGDFFKEQTDNG